MQANVVPVAEAPGGAVERQAFEKLAGSGGPDADVDEMRVAFAAGARRLALKASLQHANRHVHAMGCGEHVRDAARDVDWALDGCTATKHKPPLNLKRRPRCPEQPYIVEA